MTRRPDRTRVLGVTAIALLAAAAVLGGCAGGPATGPTPPPGSTAPGPTGTGGASGPARRPDHIVVAVFENKSADQIDGNSRAPYLNSLMATSAVLTDSHAVAHPSQPNYLALFSGSVQGVYGDGCPVRLGSRPNLGSQLLETGQSFTGYSEGLPQAGFAGCHSDAYAAKHNPWVDFSNLPAAANQPLTAFPSDYATLPTVAFVIPDLCGDMHDCSVRGGDTWARDHLDGYARWATTHNSLLIVTFDEDDNDRGNHILTFVTGAGVRAGRYGGRVTHYSVLGAIEDLCGLPRLGSAATAAPLPDIWS